MYAILTSAHGDTRRVVPADDLAAAPSEVIAEVVVRPDRVRQKVEGIGSSLTQAAAAALATLSEAQRDTVLRAAFGPEGAALTLVRTHIGSCDFSTESYTLAPTPDASLADFSLDIDRENGLLQLLKDAQAVPGARFRVMASPWTAPPWMKDNQAFFDPTHRRGGRLLSHHHDTFARYTARYVEEMAAEGLAIWALTPVNEPHGNQGSWESMEMTPQEQARYVATLGRVLAERGQAVCIYIYDQNRAGMRDYVAPILSAPDAKPHVAGVAVHWYDSTFRVYGEELEAQHNAWPDVPLLHTEGCIDNVFSRHEDKGPGAATPWWRNDPWFWGPHATDWGWDWLDHPEVDHPPYAPAFRYARDLVAGLAHRLTGWIDWNLVLTRRGGPNHAQNYCLAPILVDGDAVYFTPLFHILAQVSRHTRPGATVVALDGDLPVGLHLVALVGPDGTRVVHSFNETDRPVALGLRWNDDHHRLSVPPACLLTCVWDSPPPTVPMVASA
jgi:glucosylceramidase